LLNHHKDVHRPTSQMGSAPVTKYLLPRSLSNDLIPIVDLLLAILN